MSFRLPLQLAQGSTARSPWRGGDVLVASSTRALMLMIYSLTLPCAVATVGHWVHALELSSWVWIPVRSTAGRRSDLEDVL